MSGERILVVDDSELSRLLIRRLLERQGYEILTAADGAEGAVTALREHPDVVVTDLDMPVMDGYQLARLLKSDPASDDIPVLILTSHAEASSRFWGRETGADGYLVKDEVDVGLTDAVRGLLEAAPERTRLPVDPPQTPLEVLARVSRHLDRLLLESVLINRVLQRGVEAEGLEATSDLVLRAVSQVVDVVLLGILVHDADSTQIFLRPSGRVEPDSQKRFVESMLATVDVADDVTPTVVTMDGSEDGPEREAKHQEHFVLPLRGGLGLLSIAPRGPLREESRERGLVTELTSHLGLVIDNARLAQRLRELSMIDGLTKLLNRATVHRRLVEELARAARYDHPLSLILCDLDHFKRINDTHGHLAGDCALAAVSAVLQKHGRAADVIGRYGGEEFVLILPNVGLEQACNAARRLLEELRRTPIVLPSRETLTVTASFGVAAMRELEAPTPDGLLGLADERLYAAKDGGRDQVLP